VIADISNRANRRSAGQALETSAQPKAVIARQIEARELLFA
jgi:hypothetical protein